MSAHTTKNDPYLLSLKRTEVNATLADLAVYDSKSMLHQLIWEPAEIGNLVIVNVPFNGIGYKVGYALDNWYKARYDENAEFREVLVRTVARQFQHQINRDVTIQPAAVEALMQAGGFLELPNGWARDGVRWVFPADILGLAVCYTDNVVNGAFSMNFDGAPQLEYQLMRVKHNNGLYIHPGIFRPNNA